MPTFLSHSQLLVGSVAYPNDIGLVVGWIHHL